MKTILIMLSAMLLLTSTNNATANIITSCTNDSVTLDTVSKISDASNTNLLVGNYDATNCVGTFSGQDFFHDSRPSPFWNLNYTGNNIGEENDGLLNGQGNLFDGMEFIDEDDLLDLDGDGEATDPGWIHLGDAWKNWGSGFSVDYDELGPNPNNDDPSLSIEINDLLTLTFGCGESWRGFFRGMDCNDNTGWWALETDEDVIENTQDILGRNSFDHLAFSINSATEFAVYDFDFEDIFITEAVEHGNTGFDFSTPYALSGTFNMDDFPGFFGSDAQPLHINVWARDPFPEEVPEPETLLIFGIALGALSIRKRLKTSRLAN